jgi:hypothetical protein
MEEAIKKPLDKHVLYSNGVDRWILLNGFFFPHCLVQNAVEQWGLEEITATQLLTVLDKWTDYYSNR